jgi:putative DNA primase/helicase
VSWDTIPAELRERRQWVLWTREERDGKETKVPYRADLTGRASTTDATTWAPFEVAVRAAGSADGVGYVFAADDPFVGVDLDAGLSEADRGAVMLALDSYTETSVSGEGVHVIVRASLNGHKRNRQGPFEVYEAGRYFVMTGQHVQGTPATIEDRQAELEMVLEQYLPKPKLSAAPAALPAQPVDLDDQQLLEKARRAKNGAKFERLYAGDTSGYPSRSEADLALCSLLSFWSGRDPARIDRLFRTSGLMRPKWERADYRERTIEEAIGATSETYQGSLTTVRLGPTRASESAESVTDFRASPEEGGRNRPTDSALIESVGLSPPSGRVRQEDGTDSDPESVADSERPFAVPIREFVARPREHREPILADADGRAVIGHRSLTLLGALGGHGKTTFFIDLALCLAAGVDYPPFAVPAPISILIIENEGPEELFAEKLEARLATFPHELKGRLDVCVFDWGGISLADNEHHGRLVHEVAEKGYDLVFGDPLDSLGIEGVGSPEDTRKFLGLMKQTGLNKTVAWWLNTHPRKEETKEALNEISGAWGGKPDSVLLLRMLEDDRTRLRFPKLRWAKRGKRSGILLKFDPDTEAFSYLGEEAEEERDYLAEVRGLLEDGKWRIPKEIAAPRPAGIGANVDVVKKILAEHPDVFESRTGEEAKALGRSPSAVLWQLRAEQLNVDELEDA